MVVAPAEPDGGAQVKDHSAPNNLNSVPEPDTRWRIRPGRTPGGRAVVLARSRQGCRTAHRRVSRRPALRHPSPGAVRPASRTSGSVPRAAARLVEAGGGPWDHLRILVTRPAPTVRPPSRIANLRPSSIAIGWIISTRISVLSPGMTISVPSGRCTTPVTSVVRK